MPKVQCIQCGKTGVMKFGGGAVYTVPDLWVSVRPLIEIHGALRDPQANGHVIKSIQQKEIDVFYCPKCSGAEAHTPIDFVHNTGGMRRVQRDDEPSPENAPRYYEPVEEAPAPPRRRARNEAAAPRAETSVDWAAQAEL